MKKFKKVLLHVGPDKTGSTAIQTVFDHNRDLMSSFGIHYPLGAWHAELGSCFCDAPEKYIFNELSGFRDRKKIQKNSRAYLSRLREELQQSLSDVLVLSYEGFVDLDEASLIRFRDFIAEHATTCEVVFYARSPLSYVASAMSQRVKSGIRSCPDGDPIVMPSMVYLERLGRVFGKEKLNVRKFARDALPNGDVVLDFLSLLDMPDSARLALVDGTIRENPALSAEALQIGDLMIGLLGGLRPLGNTFFDSIADLLSKIKGQKILLSTRQMSAIERASKEHSDYLASEFGISFASENYEAEYKTPLISQRTADSLAKLLLELALPKVGVDREKSSPDLTLISAALREDKNVVHGQLMTFDVDFFLDREVRDLEMGIHIFDSDRRWAFGINSTLLGQSHQSLPSGSYRVSHHLIADLPAGKYTAGFAFAERLPEGRQLELAWRDMMCEFQVYHQASKIFAGYSYLPAEISLCPTRLALAVTQPVGSLVSVMPVSSMVFGEQASIGVTIVNSSEQDWVGDNFRPVTLSYHWLNDSGEMLVYDGRRTPLPAGGVSAGQTLDTEMLVVALYEAGIFILVLTLVQEFVGWFEDKGFEAARLTVEVMVPLSGDKIGGMCVVEQPVVCGDGLSLNADPQPLQTARNDSMSYDSGMEAIKPDEASLAATVAHGSQAPAHRNGKNKKSRHNKRR